MDAKHEKPGVDARSRRRQGRILLEPLETRDLMAAGGSITDIATLPKGLTVGPMTVAIDNNLWFSEPDGTDQPTLAKLSATGQRTVMPLPASDAGYTITGVAADAKGNVWYALAATSQAPAGSPDGMIGKMTTAGAVTQYALPSSKETPGAVAIGSNGNPYVAVSGGPSGPAIDGVSASGTVSEMPVKGASGPLTWLTSGPDGNLWFVDHTKIGKITLAGVATEYTVPAPEGSGGTIDLTNAQLTTGPDGNLWFLGLGGFAKITPTGTVTSVGGAGALITGLANGSDGNLWLAMVPPAGSQLAETAGENVMYMAANGSISALSDNVDTGTNVLAMANGGGAVWLNEGGTAVSRINLASLQTLTPPTITPTTTAAVVTNAKKTFYGPLVSFTANYPGALASDFTATINYGDGYTGTGQVVGDPNGDGGFEVYGYNTYTNTPVGSQVKATVDVTGLNGSTSEIYGIVDVNGPALTGKAKLAAARAAALAAAKARRAAIVAAHPKGPAGGTSKKK